jgi:ATP-dependent helicase/nuclease subunit B
MKHNTCSYSNIITFSGEHFFASALADYLLHEAQYKDDLPLLHLIVPNKQAIGAVQDALFRQSGAASLLLPRISTFADIAPQHWLSGDALAAFPVAKIVDAQQRLLWVSDYVQQLMPELELRSALYYAESFLALRDDAQRAMKSTQEFDALVDSAYAAHWQDALAMFKRVMHQLDARLQESGMTEPIPYHNHLCAHIAEYLTQHPLVHPVVVAGSTASIPASAILMQAIATQEKGCVVLPSLDMHLAEKYWDTLSYSHPQYHMKQFLQRCGVHREAVKCIEFSDSNPVLISQTMYPEDAAQDLHAQPLPPHAMQHIELYETDDDIAEMQLCALLILDAIHHKTKNIAVITEQRATIDGIEALLAPYGVTLDRYAASPLAHSAEYQYVMLCAALLFEPYRSTTLLSLLRHPLCLPEYRKDMLAMADKCDAGLLRGLHYFHSVAEVCTAYMQKLGEDNHAVALLKHIFSVQDAPTSCEGLFEQHRDALMALLQQHSNATIASMMEELSRFTSLMHDQRHCTAEDYRDMIIHYFAQHPVYDNDISYSPIRIMGAIEARMHEADVVIIPHMNEGHWPRHMTAEPWLNHAMRRSAGLNFAERQIGLAAHDISTAMKAPRFIALRARKECNTPMQASRFFERLQLTLHPYAKRIQQQQSAWHNTLKAWRTHHMQRVKADMLIVQKPAPNPPLPFRHTRLSATQCETLMKNPFLIYVSHILKLKDRDPYDEAFGIKHFGIAAHQAMQKASLNYTPKAFDVYHQSLSDAFVEHLQEKIEPELRHFYIKKLGTMLNSIVAEERVRLDAIKNLLAEHQLEKRIDVDSTTITFTMRADRIEELQEAAWRIVDYKTGTIPATRDIELGTACQLLVAGWIARDAHRIEGLEYWGLKGKKSEPLTHDISQKLPLHEERFWQEVQEGLTNLARYYCCTPNATYDWIDGDNFAQGAAHIARVGEW